MLGQFSGTIDSREARDAYHSRLGRKPDRNVRTLDLMSYHLRSLLHRNDTMGMAASIEARFPFLDEDLVHTAINFPYRYKARLSTTVWEKEHPFIRDKWVVREVADRYIPKNLSRRKKWGFEVSAIRRMQTSPEYFRDSFFARHFKLSHQEMTYFLNEADRNLKTRILMLETWGQMFINDVPVQTIQDKLLKHASIQKPN
ncbi:MAG: asparagine synthase (glutamine-hydrolyzing) [Gammaproteobacteria bacterium]|jgi:asparagine synthase (glutamine-hydrolysing)